MADVKRLNYFTSQFLVEKDFTDEQGYLMNMRRRHNQLLHTWGIADGGLQVTKSADKIIGISSGMAVDKDGRELVLLDARSEDLTKFGSNADVYITAKYEEVFDPGDHYTVGGIDNYTRTTERPLVEAGTTVPVNDGSVIVLAKVKLDGGGTISTVDSTVRKIAGSAIDPTVNLAANSLSVTGNATVGGNIGIGTTSPSHKFHVVAADAVGLFESSGGQAYLRLSTNEGLGNRVEITNRPGGRLSLWTAGGGDVFNITKDGKVGIGTVAPQGKLEVVGDIRAGNSDLYFTKVDHQHTGFGNTLGYAAIENDGTQYGALMILGRTVKTTSTTLRVVKLYDYLQINGDLEVTANIGTHGFSAKPKTAGWAGGVHTWDVEAEGTIWARNGSQSGPRDLAENYYSDVTLDPGDVACLDRKEDRIVKSERANDDLIIGVISTLPGFLLGAEHGEDEKRHDGKRAYPVALSGRVPCNVTDENGPINRGDLLTSSSTIGHAMKATPRVVGGVEIFAPGTIIGKALESLHSGTGVIEVFVTLR
ncbi:MAG: hypothetical protein P0119_02235 [Nitrospira sp.]|nr:hypothetical protein [Nitrospira sp.]